MRNRKTSKSTETSPIARFAQFVCVFCLIVLVYCIIHALTHPKSQTPEPDTDSTSSTNITELTNVDVCEFTTQFCLSSLTISPDSATIRIYTDTSYLSELVADAEHFGQCIPCIPDYGLGEFPNLTLTLEEISTITDHALSKPNCTGVNFVKTFTADQIPNNIREIQQHIPKDHYIVHSYINRVLAEGILGTASTNSTQIEELIFEYPVCLTDTKFGYVDIPLAALQAALDVFDQNIQTSIIYETPFDCSGGSPIPEAPSTSVTEPNTLFAQAPTRGLFLS